MQTATQDSQVAPQTADLEPVRQAAAAAEWLVLVGCPDGELVEAALACGGPVLVVLPEGGLLEALQEQGYGPWPERLSSCEALLAAEAGEVCWYCYNDSRRNGTRGPEELEPLMPNLTVERLELRPSRPLAQVLEAWGEASNDQGVLVLAEGDPEAVLAGAGPWLGHLAALLVAPGMEASSGAIDSLVQPQALARQHGDGGLELSKGWTLRRRDERRLLERQLADLSAQREGLLQERDALELRVEELQAQLSAESAQTAEQSQQREALQTQVEELQGQLSAQSAQTAEHEKQREMLKLRVGELQDQLSAQSAQTSEQSQQREALQARVEELQGLLNAKSAQTAELTQQGELLQARVEDLQAQLSAQSAQTAEQSQQRDALQTRAEELQGQLNSQISQTVGQSQQREALQTLVDELQGQLNAKSSQIINHNQQNEAFQVRINELEGLLNAQAAEGADQDHQRKGLENQISSLQKELEREKLLNADIISKLQEESPRLEMLEVEKQDLLDQIYINDARIALLLKELDALSTTSHGHGDPTKPKDSNNPGTAQEAERAAKCKPKKHHLLAEHLHASKKSSDKWLSYCHMYDRIFKEKIEEHSTLKILEIGVQNGGSLEAWRSFFGDEAQITGIDVDHKVSLLKFNAGINCLIGDATDPEWMETMAAENGPFDIIIDDGSHKSDDIVKTFCILAKHLEPSGIYIVEDLHASYAGNYGGGSPGCKQSAMEFFKEIADLVNLEHWLGKDGANLRICIPRIHAALKDRELVEKDLLQISSVEFANSMAIIRRAANETPVSLGLRIVSPGEAKVCNDVQKLNLTRF